MKDKTIRMQRKNGINLHKERFGIFILALDTIYATLEKKREDCHSKLKH